MIREFHFSEKGEDRFEIMIKFVYNTEMILQFVIPLEQCVLPFGLSKMISNAKPFFIPILLGLIFSILVHIK